MRSRRRGPASRRCSATAERSPGTSRMRLVRRYPLAGETLGAGDLRLGHLTRNLEAIALGVVVAAHGREVEPLVRLDEIDVDVATYAIHKAEVVERVRRGAVIRAFLDTVRTEFKPCHDDPAVPRPPAISPPRCNN